MTVQSRHSILHATGGNAASFKFPLVRIYVSVLYVTGLSHIRPVFSGVLLGIQNTYANAPCCKPTQVNLNYCQCSSIKKYSVPKLQIVLFR
jgi:hypothetical protein